MQRAGKILIVDDEKSNRQILEANLLSEGYLTFQASNGKEAIQLTKEISPDMILLDVMMPELDGFAVCQRLKNDPATKIIPVIIITALDDRETRICGLEAGADDFLTKPVNPLELKARVRSLIRVKRYYEQIEDMNQKLLANMIKAQQIQRSLMPKEFPQLEEVHFEAFYQAAEIVGGDYYNVYLVDEENICIYVADVTGHGLDAAMLTIFIKETINSYIRQSLAKGHNLSPRRCLAELDEKFKAEDFPDDIFITIFLGFLNLKSKVFTYSSAGFVEFPYVFGPRGVWQLHCPGSLIISFGTSGGYEEKTLELQLGERILFYTDGLVEQQADSGEFFGPERLRKLLEKYQMVGNKNLLKAIISSAQAFSGTTTFQDDIVLLQLTMKGVNIK